MNTPEGPLALRSMMHNQSNLVLLSRVHVAMATFVPKQDRAGLRVGQTAKAPGPLDLPSPEYSMQLQDSTELGRQMGLGSLVPRVPATPVC